MTIEDLPDPSTEGNSLTRQYQYFIQSSEGSVTYSVSAAPMPSECGKDILTIVSGRYLLLLFERMLSIQISNQIPVLNFHTCFSSL